MSTVFHYAISHPTGDDPFWYSSLVFNGKPLLHGRFKTKLETEAVWAKLRRYIPADNAEWEPRYVVNQPGRNIKRRVKK